MKMKNFKTYLIAFFAFFFCGVTEVVAQEKDKSLPAANEQYAAKNFTDAEAEYRISNSKFPNRSVAPFNLGNAIYKQNQPSEAKYAYAKALKNARSRVQKHKAFHNLGNAFMKEKNYTEAVEAYKNALRNGPSDEETRYNFALAKKMLKENPPKDNKDKDKKGDQNKDKEGKDKEDKKPQPKPGGILKERLNNLLDAVNNEEKKVQDKVNAKKVKGQPTKTEKDW
tara:strand:- start:791 stop:1465 length:675 start_codon:yes stop_codon:yes gene_type:complete